MSHLFLAGLVAGCVLSVLLGSLSSFARDRRVFGFLGEESPGSVKPPPICSPPSAFSTLDAKENLFIPLTIREAISIRNWLMRPELGLNLTRGDEASVSDNFIDVVEAFRPKKADAIAYYDGDSKQPPHRAARVVINRGGDQEPTVRNFLVYPLPISSKTTMEPLLDIYHKPVIPHNARGISWNDDILKTSIETFDGIQDIIRSLFPGGEIQMLPNDTLSVTPAGPWSFDGSFRRAWFQYKWLVPGSYLNRVNLWQYIDMTGTDRSLWKTLKLMYNHQVYGSKEEFVESFNNGSMKITEPLPPNSTWFERRRKGRRRELDHLAGPRHVSFDGPRFRVNKDKQFVTWMGWSFYLGFDRDMGLSLWNINFLGERIIYEVSAMAQYTGNDPHQATTSWLDRYFGMGLMTYELIPGYDCPQEAVYLPSIVHLSVGTATTKNAICIFEKDNGGPLTRHRSMPGFGGEQFTTGAVKDYVLVVRTIASFDYTFMLDGSLEVRVSASGYLQGGYWEPGEDAFGTRIHNRTMGTLHDHIVNFKVDLDISGVENSLLETSVSVDDVEFPWLDEDWGSTIRQQRIVKKYITNETEARLFYPKNFEGGYSIVNKKSLNAWGYPRGYTIVPGNSPIHSTVAGSRRMLNNANFAKYNLAVSRRKDNEPSSSSAWNLNLPGAPPVDFDLYFDGESLDQEDLVVWINLGTHHFPSAEDSPNTRMNTATSSFIFSPLNFHDYDVSIESSNAVLISLPKRDDDVWPADENGVRTSYCTPPRPTPLTYRGEVYYDLDGSTITYPPALALFLLGPPMD
ncbi:copper amine oxidase [Cantharellus anzutake]|uniref:copper amine oxidase n=1 Tax=Cantharellus anzutake TaxID=1750568 RepID=UPI0019052686|nr:copper amine oxidase [Cantharellus anzutake]KAF8324260.1 copper amine oxidase [Cantharellus anzutake]